MTDAVVVHDVVKRFGATAALAGVSFAIRAGELFGFIGPDGAGKTTLFRILTTLLIPDSGSAQVLGEDVVRNLWSLRKRVGYMSPWVQTVSLLNPVRHFVTISRALLVKGAGLQEIVQPLAILALFAVATLALAIRQYSKRTA